MKVCFETFGCRLNRAEALEEEARYLAAGWQRTEHHSDANLIVVRGCSVTARAQHDCEQLIAHLRRKYPNTRLIVNGCLKERTMEKSAVVGVPSETDAVPTRTARAYLKVQDGCSGKCTFCIVPQFRGPSVSVDFEEVLGKARRFIDAGYHEIVVTGCNLSLYASSSKRLPELISALADLAPEDCRIRLGSVEPGACAMEVVQAMSEHANVCRYLHTPVQSASNRILAEMRRPYLFKDIEDLLHEAQRLLPDIGLGCDVMTGFPSETAADFDTTKALLKRYPFSNVHVFPYSERPGTLAAAFNGGIDREIRRMRARELEKIVRQNRERFAKRFLGKEVEVVVEGHNHIVGWTSEYLWFQFKRTSRGLKDFTAAHKSKVRFRVNEVHEDRLHGIPVV